MAFSASDKREVAKAAAAIYRAKRPEVHDRPKAVRDALEKQIQVLEEIAADYHDLMQRAERV